MLKFIKNNKFKILLTPPICFLWLDMCKSCYEDDLCRKANGVWNK